ncbi:hypothetical protein Tco_1444139, partial [Tanacetum coccineum]
VIDARVLLEEKLRTKERNVKERRNDVKWMNAIELQKQESMINARTTLDVSLNSTAREGKSNNPRINTDAEGAQISKDGSKNDNAIAKASHK